MTSMKTFWTRAGIFSALLLLFMASATVAVAEPAKSGSFVPSFSLAPSTPPSGFVVPQTPSTFTSLRVHDGTSSPDLAIGVTGGNAYIEGTFEVDGAARLDGAVDLNSTLDASGIVTANGGVTLGAAAELAEASGNGAVSFEYHAALADAGKAAIDGNADEPTGIVWVVDVTNGTACSFILPGDDGTVVEITDTGTDCTATEDNDTTVNVYHDAGNDRFEINNETGGAADFIVLIFKQ